MLTNKLTAMRAEKDADDRGFTLIELLVVVVIIGILIAIAIPLYLNYQKGAHDKSAQSDLRGAVSALEQCYSENSNAYPAATSSNTKGTSASFTCGSASETANLSSGTTFVYTPACAGTPSTCTSYTITTNNDGGHGKTYTYVSTTGGQIQ
jgi:type IV pilus assembly protein PilA